MRFPLGLPVCAIVAVCAVAPSLSAQQREDNLRSPAPVADTANASALFPLAVTEIAPGQTAADRYRIFSRRIDSVGELGSRLTAPSMMRDEIAQTASRLVLFSQIERDIGFGGVAPGIATGHSGFGSMDWINLVSLAGFSGLARNTFLAPDESDQTVLGSLRTAGQWAGMATAAGGASWLISNLTRHSVCLARVSCRRPTTDKQNR